MRKLFLDDERFPVGEGWAVVRSVAAAQDWVLVNGSPGYVSFDNDLGYGLPEGRDFANWLIERDLDVGGLPPDFNFYVHSQNPVARDAIERKLRAYLMHKSAPLETTMAKPTFTISEIVEYLLDLSAEKKAVGGKEERPAWLLLEAAKLIDESDKRTGRPDSV